MEGFLPKEIVNKDKIIKMITNKNKYLQIIIIYFILSYSHMHTFAIAKSEQTENPVQIVRILTDKTIFKKNEHFQVNVQYDATDGAKTIGIGLQVHYDSSCLELLEFNNYKSKLISIPLLKEDDDDLDNNEFTDKTLRMAWLDLSINWPSNEDLPFNAITLIFRVKPQTSCTNSCINVTETSHDSNYNCRLENIDFTILNLLQSDINLDGLVDLKDIIQTIKFISNKE